MVVDTGHTDGLLRLTAAAWMCEALAMAHLGSGPELLYALRRCASAAQASVAAVYPLSGSPLRPSSLCLSCSCAPVLTPTLT